MEQEGGKETTSFVAKGIYKGGLENDSSRRRRENNLTREGKAKRERSRKQQQHLHDENMAFLIGKVTGDKQFFLLFKREGRGTTNAIFSGRERAVTVPVLRVEEKKSQKKIGNCLFLFFDTLCLVLSKKESHSGFLKGINRPVLQDQKKKINYR